MTVSGQSYPFSPKSSPSLQLGDFWPIPLVDGSFGCGRVLQHSPPGTRGAKVSFFGGLMDWRGDNIPSSEALAGSAAIRQGVMHIKAITRIGGQVIGNRLLEFDGLEPWLCINGVTIQRGYLPVRSWTRADTNQLPRFGWWGWNFIWLLANYHFLGVSLPTEAEPASDSRE